jgi:hypothetical protein
MAVVYLNTGRRAIALGAKWGGRVRKSLMRTKIVKNGACDNGLKVGYFA